MERGTDERGPECYWSPDGEQQRCLPAGDDSVWQAAPGVPVLERERGGDSVYCVCRANVL